MSARRVSRFDRLALPMDPETVARIKPASYYAAQDAARLAAEAAVTPEERAADAWWDALPADERTKARRRFASAIFAEDSPGLAVLAYRECAK